MKICASYLMRLGSAMALLASLSGCSLMGLGGPDFATLSGQASYRERMMLPEDSTLNVSLRDASAENNSLVAETSVNHVRTTPMPFTLQFDRNSLDEAHRYTLDARVTENGRLLFKTKAPVEVLTQGAPTQNVELLLQKTP